MALHFIRHGQTNYNAEQRFQGQKDIPLNSIGKEQALHVRQLLQNENITLTSLISSPLSRAIETARIIADDNIQMVVEPNFTEIDLGQYDGCLEIELAQTLGPKEYETWRNSFFEIPAPDGESLNEVRRRVRPAIERIGCESRTSEIGIVAHQGVIMAMKSVISRRSEPKDLQSFKQSNEEVDVWDCVNLCRIKTIRPNASSDL